MTVWSPPSYAPTVRHSMAATQPCSTRASTSSAGRVSKPVNWSSKGLPRKANQRDASAWSAASTDATHEPDAVTAS